MYLAYPLSLETVDMGFRWECLWKGQKTCQTPSNFLFVMYVFVSTILAHLLALSRSSLACQLGCT